MPDGVLADQALLRRWPLPEPGSDKEERGRLLVVAGTEETPGAGLLAAEAALRAGAGKVQLATAGSCVPALGVAVPELMVTEAGDADRVVELTEGVDAVLLGPGFTDAEAAAALVGEVLDGVSGTVVLDALATAYVTEDPERVAGLPATVVLTVNPTELARCLRLDEDQVASDLAGHTVTLAHRTGATVVCGGPTKYVAHGDDLWRVEAGNPGLGTAGSGDVQAGVVSGLLGRGAEPEQAAVWGAYVHAAAGDRLAERVGSVGYLARELPPEVPAVLRGLTS
jgi:ADP-dependent NAD(P)H-hydrate dehydratase